MTFGPNFTSPATAAAADWVGRECTGDAWTVGSLVPCRYESYLEVESPPSDVDAWWDAYRDVFAVIADVGGQATATPRQAWYAVWEGHGFDVPRREIDGLCRFSRPYRSYYLLGGDVSDVVKLRWPGERERWFRPDLWWPEDRTWFVGTDVDFWRIYVGGDASFTGEVAAAVPTRTQLVHTNRVLEPED
jgi:hypothetical protein